MGIRLAETVPGHQMNRRQGCLGYDGTNPVSDTSLGFGTRSASRTVLQPRTQWADPTTLVETIADGAVLSSILKAKSNLFRPNGHR